MAQTGPGGVGNSSTNVLWLKADDLSSLGDGTQISTWSDQSGNSHNATQDTSSYQPTVQLDEINGRPTVQLDGSDDHFDDNHTFDVRTSYGVFRMSSTLQSTSMLGQFWGSYGEQIHIGMEARNNNNRGFSFDGGGPTGTFDGRISFNGLSFSSFDIEYNGDKWTYDQAGQFAVEWESTRTITRSTIGSLIPTFSVGTHQYGGDIAEIIVYDVVHTEAERTIIENYLAAKYAIAITGDLYAYETTHGAQLIGIGQASDGTNHTSAQGDGILAVSNASGLGNSEYLFIGHDDADVELMASCDVPASYGARLERTWRAGETGDLGTVDISFDLTGVTGASTTAGDYALLISGNASFASATAHTTGATVNSGVISFTGVDMADGDYVTLALVAEDPGSVWDATDATSSTSLVQIDAGITTTDGDISAWSLAVCADSLKVSNVLTVASSFTNEAVVVFEDAGYLYQTATEDRNTGSGTYEVKQQTPSYADDQRYSYWGSRVVGEQLQDAFPTTNTGDFYTYNNAPWTLNAAATTMQAGWGYTATTTINASGVEERTFTGEAVNNGDVTLTSVGTDLADWVLLANPYPSALDLEQFATDNSNLSGSFWLWNQLTAGAPDSTQDYAMYVSGVGGTGATSGGSIPNRYVDKCQGFMVQLSSSGDIVYQNSQRSTSLSSSFFKRGNERELIWLGLTSSSRPHSNQILVGFVPDATDGYDAHRDGEKLKSGGLLTFYSIVEGRDLGVQGLAKLLPGESKAIPLGVEVSEIGTYTIRIDSLANVPVEYSVELVDNKLDQLIDLRAGEHTFRVNQSGPNRTRFSLRVNRPQEEVVTTGVEGSSEPQTTVRVVQRNGMLYVRADGSPATIQDVSVHDIQGRQLIQYSAITQNSAEFSVDNYPVGIYLVRVTTSDHVTKTLKIFFTQ